MPSTVTAAAAPHLVCSRPAPLEVSVQQALLTISAATLDRLLKPLRVSHPKGLAGKPGALLKTPIPIRTQHWDSLDEWAW